MEFGELLTSGTRGRTPLDSPALCPSGIGCGNLNPQASSGSSLPRHGLKTQSVTSVKLGEKKDRFAHLLKVANRSIFVAEGSPARCVSEREKGGDPAPRESRTVGFGAPLVTFPATGKSPGCRAERLQVGAGAASPAKAPKTWGGAPSPWGLWGPKAPTLGSRSQV